MAKETYRQSRSVDGSAILRDLTTEELALRSQSGCKASFTELVRRYDGRLHRFLRIKTGNTHDAEDLVQDTFVKAYNNIDRYRNSWAFSTWLFTIARRLAASHYRKLKRGSCCMQQSPAVAEPDDSLQERETQDALWAAARRLSANQYQALHLRYCEGFSTKDIAHIMGKTTVNVKVLLYRARNRLAADLDGAAVVERGARAGKKDKLQTRRSEGASCSAGCTD